MKPTDEQNVGMVALLAKHVLVFAVGFFGLAAQTLLFRDFFAVYEGNELGIAAFFCSWLLWVGLGALAASHLGRAAERASQRFALLPLLYIPAYLLQLWVIDHARVLAGATAYEVFPFARVFPVSIATNAPVGFLSGLLFTLACRWLSGSTRLPAARVYIAEAAGAFAGGVAVTLLLGRGVSGESVFVYSASLLVLTVAFLRWTRRAWIQGAVLILGVGAVLQSGLDRQWTEARTRSAWRRIMEETPCEGTFTTPQAKYIYGEYGGQFNVLAWNSVTDSIPNTEHASEILAVLLAQHPDARRFLVLGAGGSFSLCRRLTELSQAERIVWLSPDPAYPGRLLQALPASLKTGAERITLPAVDPRRYLDEHRESHDMVIINLPDVTTLALNRYYTRGFFAVLKKRLAPDGLLAVRVSGGENVMGGELVNVGASVYRTLTAVFPHLVIKPGDETWLMASEGTALSPEPATLRDRFSAIPGAAQLYPPEALLSLYLPDRMAFQEDKYRAAAKKDRFGLLLNTDRHPRALLHNLLFAARRSGAGRAVTTLVHALAGGGFVIALLPILLYAVLRPVYVFKRAGTKIAGAPSAGETVFDSHFLVFSTGAVGMSLSIWLMFMFQSALGSLYLYVGLVSALFMLGLAMGGVASERLVAIARRHPFRVAVLPLLLQGAMLGGLCFMPAIRSAAVYGALFLAAGVLNGVYVPVAAAELKRANIADRAAGGLIGLWDHLGGAVGGLLAGLILLPLLGGTQTLVVLAAALAVNLVPSCYRRGSVEGGAPAFAPARNTIRSTGYTLFGLAAFLMIASLALRSFVGEDTEAQLASTVAAMARDAKLEKRTTTLASGQRLTYFAGLDAEQRPSQWFFATDKLAPGVVGYGGPVVLAVAVDTNGAIQALAPLRSNETPAYMDAVRPWMSGLILHGLFQPAPFKNVNAVTGATITSDAVLRTLREAGVAFAGQVLGLNVASGSPAPPGGGPLAAPAVVVAFAVLALLLRALPGSLWRRVFLLFAVFALGIRLNLQYSLAHVFSLVGLKVPGFSWSAPFLLTVVLPLLVLLAGNIYCGYLCPFGLLQELVAWLRPARFNTDPGAAVRRYGRLVKYAVLFFFAAIFAFSLNPSLASADPLVTLFGGRPRALVWKLGAAVLVLSFFYDRFWCRYLCPTGAFLSVLNGVQGLRRFLPTRYPKLCVYGIEDVRELDCICCDRCRKPAAKDRALIRQASARPITHPWGALCLAAVVIVAGLVVRDALQVWHRSTTEQAPIRAGAAGVSRDVDMERLEARIRLRELSDHEAMYYKQLPAPAGGKAPEGPRGP